MPFTIDQGGTLQAFDIISKKRDGHLLNASEIDFMVQGYTRGSVSSGEMAAFLTVTYLNGLDFEETLSLTRAMVNSGKTLDLSSIPGPKVDKHSTGGVGDKTTLVLAPLVAACGVKVAKMSGRGLGFTGGTLDKLESIPGFRTDLTIEQFMDQLYAIGVAITSQTEDLVPADKKIYALRDRTATISSIPLIASSVMSKKIAAGCDAIVLDVKTGSGAFMKSYEEAKELAELMVAIGSALERQTIAIISNMDQPLGYAIGNVLEVKEAIETLRGKGPKDLTELCLALGSQMLILAGRAFKQEDARDTLYTAIDTGDAMMKFEQLVEAQGGERQAIMDPDLLPKAKIVQVYKAKEEGYVSSIQAEKIGWAARACGDGACGILLHKKVGDSVEKGEVLAEIHTGDQASVKRVTALLEESFEISDRALTFPLIFSIIRPHP